jgi:hypothetical protein
MGTLLNRSGYGSAFNNIYMTDTTVKKEYKNDYGKMKLLKEIKFYKHLKDNMTPFSTPSIYEMMETSYTMQNLKGYVSLYTVFPTFTPELKSDILKQVYKELDMLHASSFLDISKEKLEECLIIETHTKIVERVPHVKDLVDAHSYIKRVNGIVLKSFDTILSILSQKIKDYLATIDSCRLNLIHGDCQFNNVLYNPTTGHIAFIDPRGYFGSIDLYGMPEYDSAKVLFALSGYDVFDNMDAVELDIQGDTLYIPNLFQIEGTPVFKHDDIASVLAIAVWLGNAHCFKHNPPKAVFSYFYALYLATLYLVISRQEVPEIRYHKHIFLRHFGIVRILLVRYEIHTIYR